jgi:hypothetical protein
MEIVNHVTSNLRTKKQRRRTVVFALLKRLGINCSMQNAKPSSMNIPNKETLAAIEDARNGNGERYTSLGVMWADLDSD